MRDNKLGDANAEEFDDRDYPFIMSNLLDDLKDFALAQARHNPSKDKQTFWEAIACKADILGDKFRDASGWGGGYNLNPTIIAESKELFTIEEYGFNLRFFKHEKDAVLNNLRRAKKLNLPADLTLTQWLTTLIHYRFLCAYCEIKQYNHLEHFIPLNSLDKRSGTTYKNCVPACATCNYKKGKEHPANILPGFRNEYEPVKAYLSGISDSDLL